MTTAMTTHIGEDSAQITAVLPKKAMKAGEISPAFSQEFEEPIAKMPRK